MPEHLKSGSEALESQMKFLRELERWTGVATPRDLGPQMTQAENNARQVCKRKGWVTFERGDGYWRLTDAGKAVLQGADRDR